MAAVYTDHYRLDCEHR